MIVLFTAIFFVVAFYISGIVLAIVRRWIDMSGDNYATLFVLIPIVLFILLITYLN